MFAVCWGLFLVAALVAGVALVSLYRDGTTERLRRAEAAVALGCNAIAGRYRFTTAGSARIAWDDPATERAFTAASLLALRDLPGVEGGLWRSGLGPLAYGIPARRRRGRDVAHGATPQPVGHLPGRKDQ